MKPRKAWVIQWEWTGDHAKVEPNIFHVLDSRLSLKHVEFYLRAIYFNSFWFTIEERVGNVGVKDKYVTVRKAYGCRASIGTNPQLVAMRVEKLTAKYDPDTGLDTVEYELPPIMRFNIETGKNEEETKRLKMVLVVRR
jgi:hypothetical protein